MWAILSRIVAVLCVILSLPQLRSISSTLRCAHWKLGSLCRLSTLLVNWTKLSGTSPSQQSMTFRRLSLSALTKNCFWLTLGTRMLRFSSKKTKSWALSEQPLVRQEKVSLMRMGDKLLICMTFPMMLVLLFFMEFCATTFLMTDSLHSSYLPIHCFQLSSFTFSDSQFLKWSAAFSLLEQGMMSSFLARRLRRSSTKAPQRTAFVVMQYLQGKSEGAAEQKANKGEDFLKMLFISSSLKGGSFISICEYSVSISKNFAAWFSPMFSDLQYAKWAAESPKHTICPRLLSLAYPHVISIFLMATLAQSMSQSSTTRGRNTEEIVVERQAGISGGWPSAQKNGLRGLRLISGKCQLNSSVSDFSMKRGMVTCENPCSSLAFEMTIYPSLM